MAQKSDIISFFGSPFPQSTRAIVVELDGELLGIAGVLHSTPKQAFSSITDDMRKYPKSIVKAGRKLREILNLYEDDVFAVASDTEKNSKSFLEHVGFVPHYDEVYLWQTR